MYAFYHDCVVRHLGSKSVALRMRVDEEWKEWTFDRLHRLVNYQVNRWKNHDFADELNVAIVMPLGINMIISLLLALRLGLRFTLLPTDSPLLPHRRVRALLDELELPVVLTTPEVSPLIQGDDKEHWLIEYLEESETYNPALDTTYAPDDVCQLALTCHTQDPYAFVPVAAELMYLSAQREGEHTLGLQADSHWGYVPDCSLREQPFAVLTALLHGACTTVIPESELLETPTLVESHPFDVLGITSQLKTLWTEEKGLPKTKLKTWYRPAFDDDYLGWREFVEKNKLQKLTRTRLIFDATQTGIPFASKLLTDEVSEPLWPAQNVPWALFQPDLQDLPAIDPYGLFKQETNHPTLTNFLLSGLREGWELVGTFKPHVRGYTVPIDALEEAASSLKFVEEAVLLDLRKSTSALNTRFVLLVFVNPYLHDEIESQQGDWTAALKKEISASVGSIFLPEKFEFFPLLPKCEGDKPDRNWCRLQYTSGVLFRKKTLKAYHLVSLLKKCMQS